MATVARKPGHRGEREVSRKTIAQGRPDASAEPVCSCAPFYVQLAHETAGAARTRLSLRPLFSGGTNVLAKLGQSTPRECEHMFRAPSLRAKRSNPSLSLRKHGLLRCARNDAEGSRFL